MNHIINREKVGGHLEEVRLLLEEILNKNNIKKTITLIHNKRFSKCVARASVERLSTTEEFSNKIEVSSFFLAMSRENQREVLIHELTHILLMPKNCSHNQEFKEKCKELGGKEVMFKVSEELIKDTNFLMRYVLRCNKCGGICYQSMKKTKAIKEFTNFKSICCREKLTLESS